MFAPVQAPVPSVYSRNVSIKHLHRHARAKPQPRARPPRRAHDRTGPRPALHGATVQLYGRAPSAPAPVAVRRPRPSGDPAPTGTRPRALQSRGSCTSPKTRTVHTNNTPPPSPAGPTPAQLRLAYDLCRRGNDCLPPRSVEHRSLTGPRPQPDCCGRGTRRGNRRGPPA